MINIQSLVSIIVPCYNQAQYLDECLRSVIEQSYTNWECIIINDGSSDNTREIAHQWLKKDSRFQYIYKENGGLSSARNTGLKIARGDYIQFLDSDDMLNRFKLEKQLDCFTSAIDIVICDYFPFDNETKAFKRERYMNPFPSSNQFKIEIISKWESGLSIPCHCILFKSKLLNQNEQIIRFEESLPNHEDWVFWVKVFYYSQGISNLSYSLADYRIHQESMCSDYVTMKEGFRLAGKLNLLFFENLNEGKFIKLCQEKLDSFVEKKKTFNIIKVIKLFLPPIIFKVVKK
ncbi:Glycosyltransferase involved in cell wall bisynthesis [Flavobacterium glycines]|nr:glycosyltransferase family 2 protein [Flavobacterium glycines]GEL12388.1 hypothetical protein FGL01_31270 [Flavobacterium glycines]SDJ53202.1 Glycosyltransferase involved in cell wall bisynthesis [Flavobacterium glycines]